MEQAGKGETQMEGSMLNALLEEWKEQEQFNPDDTTEIPVGFTNVCIPHPQQNHRHYYDRIFN